MVQIQLIILGLILLVIIVAAIGVLLIKRGKRAERTDDINVLKLSRNEITPGSTINVPPTVPAQSEKEFVEISVKFSGLYETLYNALNVNMDRTTRQNTVKAWESRLREYGKQSIVNSWNDVINKNSGKQWAEETGDLNEEALGAILKDWYLRLTEWGVERDGRASFTIDRNSSRYYMINDTYSVGDTAIIVSPCWVQSQNRLSLERGVARLN
jgi:hypothetical protein